MFVEMFHMPWWGIAIVVSSAFLFFALLHFLAKNKRPFKRALLSMSAGLLALAAVDLLSGLTGVYIPVSLLSVLVSAIGGVPGVTLLLFLNLLF